MLRCIEQRIVVVGGARICRVIYSVLQSEGLLRECVCFVDIGDGVFVDVNLGERVDNDFFLSFFATGRG